ncbi:MAG: thiamine pyrophosphate-binding protein [Actinobacteria bacterium]|nr:thiamine pyrophosphate-binding protein [Actinomycetota bacterium]
MTSEPSTFTKSDLVAQFLAEKKVSAVFQLSGGMIAFLTDAVSRLGKTPIISLRHEQAAGFAAEGGTRISGRSSVAMATSGPGATNLITAIASSYFDSIPTVFITGQVNQNEAKRSELQRQNGFQELDIVSTARGITKRAVSINSSTDLLSELNAAWNIAHQGRPGPVLLDIPIDVQQEPVSSVVVLNTHDKNEDREGFTKEIGALEKLISQSISPIILAGGGIRASGSVEYFRKVVGALKLPVVFSLMGVDLLPSDSPYRVGMIGSYGNRWANRALATSDLIIALGTRLDVRQTGTDLHAFLQGKKIFRVDVDMEELSGRIKADVCVGTDLKAFLKALVNSEIEFDSKSHLAKFKEEKVQRPQAAEQGSNVEFNPDDIIRWLSNVFAESNGYIVDVGQHQMWAAQSLELGAHQRFVTSGGLGAMGFALPAAIGASISQPGRWVVITGDGCTQLSIAELQTVMQLQLPITICVINNNQLGMVAQFQEGNLDGRYISTRDGYSTPDFCKVAEAFGIPALRFENSRDLKELEERVGGWNSSPLLLEFVVSREAKALPKMAMGDSIKDL